MAQDRSNVLALVRAARRLLPGAGPCVGGPSEGMLAGLARPYAIS